MRFQGAHSVLPSASAWSFSCFCHICCLGHAPARPLTCPSTHPPTSAPAPRPKLFTSTVRIAAAATTAAPAIAAAAIMPARRHLRRQHYHRHRAHRRCRRRRRGPPRRRAHVHTHAHTFPVAARTQTRTHTQHNTQHTTHNTQHTHTRTRARTHMHAHTHAHADTHLHTRARARANARTHACASRARVKFNDQATVSNANIVCTRPSAGETRARKSSYTRSSVCKRHRRNSNILQCFSLGFFTTTLEMVVVIDM